MNSVYAGLAGDAHDVGNVQVRRDRLPALADEIAFICLEAMQCKAIFVGVDADRTNAQFAGRAHHPDRDLSSVRDQQALNLLHKDSLFNGFGAARGTAPGVTHPTKHSPSRNDGC